MFEHIIDDLSVRDQNWEVIDALRSVAKDEGATPPQVALSWLTNRPGVTASIIGARNMAQLRENLVAGALRLTDASTALLDAASDPRPNDYPYGPFGRKQVDRYVASSDQALGELWGVSPEQEGSTR
jgi:diketogulonate reductase-like aldo/keto reductase